MSEVLLAVQNSVYGANHNEPGIGKKSASTPKKRPAPEDDPALKDALAQHDYKVLPLMQRSIAATCPSLFQNALTCAPHTSGSENDTASKPQDLSRQPALLHVSFALSGSQSSSSALFLESPSKSSSETTSTLPISHVHDICFSSLQALAASGKLGKLKVDDLKPYLRAHGLKVTGKKDELIERITEHIDSQP